MTSLFLLGLALTLLAGGVFVIPIHRWRFPFEGRTIEVRNYALHEVILVDGRKIPLTRVGGNHLTWAIHALALPDGRELHITVSTRDGFSMRCTAALDSHVLFDSLAAPQLPGPSTATRALLPPPPPPLPDSSAPATATTATAADDDDPDPADARWLAAATLLADLSDSPELQDAAFALDAELRRAFLRLEVAQTTAEAHAALGGTPDEILPLLQQREKDVQDLLRVLRTFHLAAAQQSANTPALSRISEVIAILRASHEAEEPL